MNESATRLAEALAGRYRIERELGAGGMATVYLAQDIRHVRKVAVKVLHPDLAAALGAERFLAEIRTTANLQHPHILPLHDSGQTGEGGRETGGFLYYVMPYVEGESLRDRLNRERQLPIDDAIRLARETASALDYAHRHGVIHRDIKPENILLHDGSALVADFGIALAVQSAGGQRMTQTGLSLGTPQYMSPEQAMGERTIDARCDIYALGAVTYEMLVGEPPFTGPTVQAIVARVLTEEPRGLSVQRKSIPPHVEAAVRRSLEKLPADRFSTAAEFATALTIPSFTTSTSPVATRERAVRGNWRNRIALPASAIAVVGLALAAWGWLRPTPRAPVTRTYLKFPDAEAMRRGRYMYALSLDGSTMVYVGRGEGIDQLWLKRRSELHATPLAGTAGAANPFISPDGKWVGFVVDAKLKKVAVAGGAAVTLADAVCANLTCTSYNESGTWLDDGRIAFQTRNGILVMPDGGGARDTLVRSVDVGGLAPILPVALPGSKGILFSACTLACNKSDLWVVDLRTKKARRLVENATFPHYSPTGHLLYSDRNGTGLAVEFDLDKLEVKGKAIPVLDGVAGDLVLSNTGTLLYLEGDASPRSELVIVSRDGRATSIDSTWRANFGTLALSPDGRRLAASIYSDGQEHIWIKPLDGGTTSRLTFGSSQNTTPTWTADGQSLLYTRFVGDTTEFLTKRADGTGGPAKMKHAAERVIESFASRDGNWLVLREYRNGARDIYAMRTSGDSVEHAVVTTPSDDVSPALSPDGKWLAYVSEESGRPEVWVCPFPDPQGSKWQVSPQGGYEPAWSHTGKELFFISPAQEMVAVDVSTTPSFASGPLRTLFSVAGYRRHPTHRAYDVLPDDQRFVMIRGGAAAAGELVQVDNWFDELKAKLKK